MAEGRRKKEETKRRAWLLLHSSFLILHSLAAHAAEDDEVAPLAPLLPELPPTFWAQHGTAMLLGGLVGAVVGAVVVWWLLRPKPVVVVPPAVRARDALAGLNSGPETGAVLSRVSQILRHYFSAAFELPAAELTTAEFSAALVNSDKIGRELAVALAEFLRRADERKFSALTAEPLNAVAKALEFITRAEARLEQLRSAQINPTDKSHA